MCYVDVHCHVAEFENLEDVLSTAKKCGVKAIVGVGDDPESNLKVIRVAETYPNLVKPCLGFHPWEAANASRSDLEEFKRQVEKYAGLIICLGEVGLDRRFVRGEDKFKRQLEVFQVVASLAREYELPLNVHAVKTEKKVLDIVREADVDRVLFHWYTGSLATLERVIELGYMVSVNLSLKYSKRAKAVANLTPLNLLLLESDSPYEFKGEYATPASVKKVASLLASIKGLKPEEVATVTTENAKRFFRF